MTDFLALDDGSRIAYHHRAGRDPGILFCPGFHSDMSGEKALALDAWCQQTGRQMTRFDYFGHGQSSGAIEKGRIARWCGDTLAVLDKVTHGPQVIVGSSMGGWMMLLAALARPARVAALVGIASAPDFTRLMARRLHELGLWESMETQGFVDMPSHYPGESSYRIEQALLAEAESSCLLAAPIDIDIPVRLLHGMQDADIPWQHSLTIAECIAGDDVELCLIKGGDHRLSRPEDIRRLLSELDGLLV